MGYRHMPCLPVESGTQSYYFISKGGGLNRTVINEGIPEEFALPRKSLPWNFVPFIKEIYCGMSVVLWVKWVMKIMTGFSNDREIRYKRYKR